MATTVDYNVLIDTANSAKSIKELRQALKDLNDARLLLGENQGAEFTQLSQAAAAARDRIDDLNDATKTAAGSGVEQLDSSLGLLKDGLLNADPGKLGIAFKGLGQAMSAVPIFLLIEGLKYVYENFDKVEQFLQDLIPGFQSEAKAVRDLQQAQDELVKTNKALVSSLDNEIAILSAQGKSESEILAVKKEKLQVQVNELQSDIALQKAKLHEIESNDTLYESYIRINQELIKKSAETLRSIGATDLAAKADRAVEVQEKLIQQNKLERSKEFRDKITEDETAIAKLQTDFAVDKINTDKKVSENAKAEYKKRRDAYLDFLDQMISIQAQYEANSKAFADAYNKEQADAAAKARDKQLESEQKANDALVIQHNNAQAEITAAQKLTFQDRLDRLKAEKDAELNNVELTQQQRVDIIRKYNDDVNKIEEEQKNQSFNNFKQGLNDFNQYAQAAFTAANDVISILQTVSDTKRDEQLSKIQKDSDNQQAILDKRLQAGLISQANYDAQTKANADKTRAQELQAKKKAFETDKKLKIASAIIAGLQGSLAAFTGAMQLGPIAGPIVGGILATLIGVMTGVQIAQINKTKFDDGGAGSSVGSGVASLAGSAGSRVDNASTQFNSNTIGQAGSTNGQSSTNQNGSINVKADPIKVVVLESDITNTQNKVKTTQSLASF